MGIGNRESSSCTFTVNPPGWMEVILPGIQPPAQRASTFPSTAKGPVCVGCDGIIGGLIIAGGGAGFIRWLMAFR